MADFPGLALTNKGLALQTRAQAGAELNFSRVALGDGIVPPDPKILLTLVDEKKSLPLTSLLVIEAGHVRLRVVLTNDDVVSGFYIREVGVFAIDPDTGIEYLYAYTNAGEFADYMPAGGGATVVEHEVDLITVVGDAANLTATIDKSKVYATQQDLEDLETILNSRTNISLDGPEIIYPGSFNDFTITDYSTFSNYSVSTPVGTASITNETVTIALAPAEEAKGITLTIYRDGSAREFSIAIGSRSIGVPSVTHPIDNATKIIESPILLLSNFVSYPSGHFTHESTDWQIATDTNFEDLIWSSMSDSESITSIKVPEGILKKSSSYYIRARFTGSEDINQLKSAWSPKTIFTTSESFLITGEIAKFTEDQSIYMGWDVDISADGTTVIVGAHAVNSSSGKAYVYKVEEGSWNLDTTLIPLPSTGNLFGQSVCISSNGKTIAVGAPGEKSVYIYSSSGGFWSLVDIVTEEVGHFGRSCTLSADGSRLAIGALDDSQNGTNAGAVCIYDLQSTWTQTAKLIAEDGAASDRFGLSISMSDDGLTLLIGAPYDDSYKGSAYVFKNQSGWNQIKKLVAIDGLPSDEFGYSVALSSTGKTALIGSRFSDAQGNNSGAAYIFKDQPDWSLETKFSMSDGSSGSEFGSGVAISDIGSVLIGASGKRSMYLFTHNGNEWSEEAVFTPSVTQGKFGFSVALSADSKTAISGAYDQNNGSAYIFG